MILDDFTNTWNYTFVVVALIAIAIGTFITLRKMNKEEKKKKDLK